MALQRAERSEHLTRAKEQSCREIAAVGPHVEHLKAIRAALAHDGIFVEEVCQAGFTSYFGYPVYAPRTYLTGDYQFNLGYGFPTAHGFKVGNPDKPVVSVAGDGGILFAIQDLATARQYRIDLISVVFNNQVFGNVMRDHEAPFDGRTIAAELVNPDFMRLVECFGVIRMTSRSPEELQACIARAIELEAPVLIEASVDRRQEQSPWPYLMPEGRRAA